MKRKVISIVICIAMMVVMMPTSAFADSRVTFDRTTIQIKGYSQDREVAYCEGKSYDLTVEEIKYYDLLLVEGSDYQTVYQKDGAAIADASAVKDVGVYTVIVQGIGEFSGFITWKLVINPVDPDKGVFRMSGERFNSDDIDPSDGTKIKNDVLAAKLLIWQDETDVTDSYESFASQVVKTAEILGDSPEFESENARPNWIDSNAKRHVLVTAQLKSDPAKTLWGIFPIYENLREYEIDEIPAQIYTGDEIQPDITVKSRDGERRLVEGQDYVVSYYNNIRVGTAKKVTVYGIGSYEGTLTGYFTINRKSITSDDISITVADAVYQDGRQIVPTVIVTDGIKKLTQDADYVVTCSDTAVGEAVATITGVGNYTGEVNKEFNIVEKENALHAQNTWVYVDNSTDYSVSYNGRPQTPSVTVWHGADEETDLPLSPDYYDVVYANNDKVGQATVTVIGKNGYAGTVSTNFTISSTSIWSDRITVEGVDSIYAYTGRPITPKVEVKDDGYTLTEGKHYTVTYRYNTSASYSRFAEIEIKAVEGSGYTGSKTVFFEITRVEQLTDWNTTVKLRHKSVIYDGTRKKPEIQSVIYRNSNNNQRGDLYEADGDYTVLYLDENGEIVTEMIKPGTYQIVINGKGKYTGSVTVPFVILSADMGVTGGESLDWKYDESGFYYHFDEPTGTLTIGGCGEVHEAPWVKKGWKNKIHTLRLGSQITQFGFQYDYEEHDNGSNWRGYSLRNLEAIEVEAGNRFYASMDGVLYNKEKTSVVKYPDAKPETTFVIPKSVEEFDSWETFWECRFLEEVSFEENSAMKGIFYGHFGNCQSLKTVMFPSSITEIGGWIFQGCGSLTSVTLPQDLTRIGKYAFANCSSLKSINLPKGLTSIATGAFKGCSSLSSVDLPGSISFIGSYAFDGCASLQSIYIPSSVTMIKKYAFANSGLTSVTGMNNVTAIGYKAFMGCGELTSFTLPNTLQYFGNSTFEGCEKLESVIIPPNVTTIPWKAFAGCTSLQNVTLRQGLTEICSHAFQGCAALESIVLPTSVKSIGRFAFADCTSLKSINFPAGLTAIKERAFENCVNLKTATLPASLKNLGSGAFKYSGLQEVNVPSTIQRIRKETFKGTQLTSVTVPSTVRDMGYAAFAECTNLTNVTVSPSVERISTYTFANCQNLKSVSLPQNLRSLGRFAFLNCTAMNAITLPETLSAIGSGVFAGCSALDNITLPQNLTSMGYYSTFARCSSLTDITVPEKIKSLPMYCFSDCTSLARVTLPQRLRQIGRYAFCGCEALNNITLPQMVSEIGNSAFAGSGLTEITIPEMVESIQDRTFANCTSLADVTLPKNLSLICRDAFSGCVSLTDIELPQSLEIIDRRAFNNCTGLTSVNLPAGLSKLGRAAFRGTGLEQVEIPQGLYEIEPETFAGAKLTAVSLPTNVRRLGYNAFRGCENLQSVQLSAGIGEGAFANCPNLAEVDITIGEVEKGFIIEANAFANDISLKAITIPQSETSSYVYLEPNSFAGVPGLQVTLEALSMLSVDDRAFESDAKIKMKCNIDSRDMRDALMANYDVFLQHEFVNGACKHCGFVEGSIESSQYGEQVIRDPLGEEQYLVFDKSIGKIIGLSWFGTPITEVNIPETIDGIAVTGIAEGAFMNETMLQTVTMGESIQTIGKRAFAGSGIKAITIPDGVTKIPGNAFNNTPLTSITLPISAAFTKGCNVPTLTSFTFTGGNGSAVDYDAITYRYTPWFENRAKDITITLKPGIVRIGDYTFAGQQVGSYAFPASVKEIGDNAFYRNKKLTQVTMQEGVEKIGYEAFAGCEALKAITLPTTLQNMKSDSFEGAEALVATVYADTYAKAAAAKYGISYRVNLSGPVVPPEEKPDVSGQGEVEIKNAIGKAGKIIEVPVNVTVNPGVAALKLNLDYDETALELVNIIDGEDFDTSVFQRVSENTSATLVWQTQMMATNVTDTGTLAILEFRIKDTAATGNYDLQLTCDEANTLLASGKKRTFNCQSAVVSVVDFIYGDVNDSSDVNINDADYLAKFIAGWAAYQAINRRAADVDLDNSVTLRDAAIIARYVAGWNGYEDLPNIADPLPLPGK